jgi:hypothetical protein
MKKILLSIFLVLFSISTAQAYSEFCSGFKQGYITGYKQAKNTSMNPMVPMCPMQPMKSMSDPQSDFEHGYLIGLRQGMYAY